MGNLRCPKCKGHDIDLWTPGVNMKKFQRTGLNLNPLHPLTPFKTKAIEKKRLSLGKIFLAGMTSGGSLFFTGIHQSRKNEYYCRECGKRWRGK